MARQGRAEPAASPPRRRGTFRRRGVVHRPGSARESRRRGAARGGGAFVAVAPGRRRTHRPFILAAPLGTPVRQGRVLRAREIPFRSGGNFLDGERRQWEADIAFTGAARHPERNPAGGRGQARHQLESRAGPGGAVGYGEPCLGGLADRALASQEPDHPRDRRSPLLRGPRQRPCRRRPTAGGHGNRFRSSSSSPGAGT